MLTAFKILMFLFVILSGMGSMAEKDPRAANTDAVLFGISGGLLLLAIVATKFM